MEDQGLYSFWQVFIRALNISPLDGNQMPTVSMLQVMNVEVEIDEQDFWQAVEFSLCYLRNHILERREEARRRAEMQAKVKARRNR